MQHAKCELVAQLLVRMERQGTPLRLLLEACSFIFSTALEMVGGPSNDSPGSPTLPFKGGVQGDGEASVAAAILRKGGTTVTGSAGAGAGVTGNSTTGQEAGVQQGWEAFNRSMDDRDQEVLKAATAATATAAGGGSGAGAKEGLRELSAPMVEVLKVSLSLLRRLSSRNLTAAGPFASTMQMWPSGHPQVWFAM